MKRKFYVGISMPCGQNRAMWDVEEDIDYLSPDLLATYKGNKAPLEIIEAKNQNEAVREYKGLHKYFANCRLLRGWVVWMKEINIKLKLYTYEELGALEKLRVLYDQKEELYNNPPDYEDKDGNICFEDINSWTDKEIKEYLEDFLKINEYLFFESGELANTTRYVGKHPKAGITELLFMNKVYVI